MLVLNQGRFQGTLFPFPQEWDNHKESNGDLDKDLFSDKNGHRESLIGRVKSIVISPIFYSILYRCSWSCLTMACMCFGQ